MSTPTLTDFLLARIAEDEEVAREAWGDSWTALTMYPNRSVVATTPRNAPASMVTTEHKDDGTANHIARHDPARVLAECEAKRRIVGEHKMMPVREMSYGLYDGCCETCTAWGEYGGPNEDKTPNYCPTLRFLALPYADHPDCREEWKP